MTRKYFGTDGIRGTVGDDPITPDFMLRLGHAVGQVLRQGGGRPTVLTPHPLEAARLDRGAVWSSGRVVAIKTGFFHA